jgi:23S rRNA pseudouridine2604 synthase
LFKPVSLRSYLVKVLKTSNKEVIDLIVKNRVVVNDYPALVNMRITAKDEIKIDGSTIKEATIFRYIAYYKPRGIESTLNKNIENNLAEALNVEERVFPVGRLDKESEGLLLLTNDGQLYEKIAHGNKDQEKEYLVKVNKPLTEEFINHLAKGVIILGQKTKPALVTQLTSHSFNIILTQGLNRQIRRMCYKLGYEVEELKRIRVVTVLLGSLKPGESRELIKSEMEILFETLDKT